jgi:hypothetical protein
MAANSNLSARAVAACIVIKAMFISRALLDNKQSSALIGLCTPWETAEKIVETGEGAWTSGETEDNTVIVTIPTEMGSKVNCLYQ